MARRAPALGELLPVGSVLADQFEIRALLGTGGMSRVYRAFDRHLHRDVAIKAAAPDLGDHLASEARLLASFRQPGLVGAYTYGWHDDVPYLVLEYLAGRSLCDQMADREAAKLGPYPVENALRLTIELADALAPLHARGLVHCDLKPGNVICAPDRLVLIDLGLARDRRAPITNGRFSGSPPFMAPEAIDGKVAPERLHLLDVYGLGMILHTLLAGAPAFEATEPAAVMRRQLDEDPPSLADLRRDLPPGLAAFVASTIARDPGRRPIDLAALRDGLHGFPIRRGGIA